MHRLPFKKLSHKESQYCLNNQWIWISSAAIANMIIIHFTSQQHVLYSNLGITKEKKKEKKKRKKEKDEEETKNKNKQPK